MSRQTSFATERGFSLVELSIVLVILGLLTGGILGGQSLIHAAELRSVSKEYEKWQTAVNIFKDKYFAIPGDMNNAIQFWGNADDGTFTGECADNDDDEGTGTQTCNGTGDGIVDENYEEVRFWQHLSNAGLIEGNYTGVDGTAQVPGENIPRSRFGNGGWGIDWEGDANGNWDDSAEYFEGSYRQTIYLGAATADEPEGDLFTPEDAWNVDTKIDDGMPGQGILRTLWEDCTTAADGSETDEGYNLAESGVECFLIFTDAI